MEPSWELPPGDPARDPALLLLPPRPIAAVSIWPGEFLALSPSAEGSASPPPKTVEESGNL